MKSSLHKPRHPERVCWGCARYCPADDLACGNGTIRTPHPIEIFGQDWLEWERPRSRPRRPRGDPPPGWRQGS